MQHQDSAETNLPGRQSQPVLADCLEQKAWCKTVLSMLGEGSGFDAMAWSDISLDAIPECRNLKLPQSWSG